MALLEAHQVSVHFGGVAALDRVSLTVQAGELTGLIGPNGAGKTTLLRTITGVVRPESGTVHLGGEDITGLPVHARVRRGLGLSHQIVRPFRGMSSVENVMIAAGSAHTRHPLVALCRWSRRPERAAAMALLEVVGIADSADAEVGSLPLGVLKRLEMARALALRPKVLMLDEPLAGLNHIEAAALADAIVALNANGQAVILIEHNLSEVIRICSRLVVLDNGRNLAEGAPETVMADPAVRAAYVGEAAA